MKKSIFILAVFFAATFANAQIVYEGIFNGMLTSSTDPYFGDFLGEKQHPQQLDAPYIIGINNARDSIFFYNKEDFSEYKRIKIRYNQKMERMCSVHKGVYTTNPEITCFIAKIGSQYIVLDEDGNEVAQLSEVTDYVVKTEIVKIGDSYKLFVMTKGPGTLIYSLPGTGEAQDVETPSAPRKSARKVLKNDQVLIENSDHIFDTQGKMVR